MEDSKETLGKVLKSIRTSQKKTLRETADCVEGISYSYLARIESNDRKNPSIDKIPLLAKAYGISTMDLLKRIGIV